MGDVSDVEKGGEDRIGGFGTLGVFVGGPWSSSRDAGPWAVGVVFQSASRRVVLCYVVIYGTFVVRTCLVSTVADSCPCVFYVFVRYARVFPYFVFEGGLIGAFLFRVVGVRSSRGQSGPGISFQVAGYDLCKVVDRVANFFFVGHRPLTFVGCVSTSPVNSSPWLSVPYCTCATYYLVVRTAAQVLSEEVAVGVGVKEFVTGGVGSASPRADPCVFGKILGRAACDEVERAMFVVPFLCVLGARLIEEGGRALHWVRGNCSSGFRNGPGFVPVGLSSVGCNVEGPILAVVGVSGVFNFQVRRYRPPIYSRPGVATWILVGTDCPVA